MNEAAAAAAPAASGAGAADAGDGDQAARRAGEPAEHVGPWRLRDHIGVISGWVLGLIVVAFLAVLAAAGDTAAFAILVTVAIGAGMIFVGLKMRGPRG
jgi:hypothetical protein